MFHSSAFPHASWDLHNCSDSQFCLHSWKEANVHTLGKVSQQLAYSSCRLLTAVLYDLYTQGSVTHALKPCPLQLCGPSLPCSPSPFVMHVPYPSATPSPCSSAPLWTSSCLLLLQEDTESLKPRKA